MICSRSDGGPFWRSVAVVKYWILVTEYWVDGQVFRFLFRQLYATGMLVNPFPERPSWKHVRLDWILITLAIASAELIGSSFLWLYEGGYVQSILSLLLSLSGWLIAGGRRTVLMAMRDREVRETELRTFFRSCGFEPSSVELEECLTGSMRPDQVVTVYRAMYRAGEVVKQQSPSSCVYHHSSLALPCAVHPSNQSMGLCNESCPDFAPKQP